MLIRFQALIAPLLVGFSLLSHVATAQDFGGVEETSKIFKKESYSPYANRNFPKQVYWGDTHLHTTLSFDAGSFGNRLPPKEAYRFAEGEQVTSSTGVDAKLSRPLDWLVVADHSDAGSFLRRLGV